MKYGLPHLPHVLTESYNKDWDQPFSQDSLHFVHSDLQTSITDELYEQTQQLQSYLEVMLSLVLNQSNDFIQASRERIIKDWKWSLVTKIVIQH